MSDADTLRVMARVEDPTSRVITVALSDGATFEVAPDAPEIQHLDLGAEVHPEDLANLATAMERKVVARKVFKLLDRRLYTRAELRERLLGAGHESKVVEPILDQFAAQGLVDDAHVAAAYIRDQLARKPVGRFWLLQKLQAKGVDSATIAAALDQQLPTDAEPTLAAEALRRKAGGKVLPKERALRFLLSRGFSRGVAAQAVLSLAAAAGGRGDRDA